MGHQFLCWTSESMAPGIGTQCFRSTSAARLYEALRAALNAADADQVLQIAIQRDSSFGELVFNALHLMEKVLISARIQLVAGTILLSAPECWRSGHHIQIKSSYGPMFRMPCGYQRDGSFDEYGSSPVEESCNP